MTEDLLFGRHKDLSTPIVILTAALVNIIFSGR